MGIMSHNGYYVNQKMSLCFTGGGGAPPGGERIGTPGAPAIAPSLLHTASKKSCLASGLSFVYGSYVCPKCGWVVLGAQCVCERGCIDGSM